MMDTEGNDGFATKVISCWKDFIELEQLRDGHWIYRGQSEDKCLTTTLERRLTGWGIDLSRGPGIECHLIRDFRRRFEGPEIERVRNDTLYCLALMRHHGAPSRLLDCTYSPFVAAQNAINDGGPFDERDPKPHVIWCFNTEWLETSADQKLGTYRARTLNRNKRRDDTTFVPMYMKNRTNFVRPDNPFGLNERLTIQQGIFLCPGNVGCSFVANLKEMGGWDSSDHVLKLKLQLKLGQLIEFAKMLRRMNISSAALFPGLDGMARSLGEHIFHYDELAEPDDALD
jgi:FRG domain